MTNVVRNGLLKSGDDFTIQTLAWMLAQMYQQYEPPTLKEYQQ